MPNGQHVFERHTLLYDRHYTKAGAIVLNPKHHILLANPSGSVWTWPTGEVQEGEDLLACVKRAVYVATGITKLTFLQHLGSYKRTEKVLGMTHIQSVERAVHMFLLSTSQDIIPLDISNPEARWMNKRELTEFLTLREDKEFFHRVVDKF